MQRYVRSTSVVSRVIAGETLIVPVRKGVGDLSSIYSLNPVASFIWETVSQPCTKADIVQLLTREFDQEPSKVEDDVELFLTEMHSAGLITMAAALEAVGAA